MRRVLLLSLAWAGLTAALRGHAEIDEAVARLNAAIAAAPAQAELYLARGELYARHADFIAAEANYLRAAELSPRLPRLDLLRGALALATGEPAGARAHLDRALAVDPCDAEALLLRARAHAGIAAGDRARRDLDAALALIAHPRAELYLERARMSATPAEAVRILDAGIARLGPIHTLQLRALELEESAGRFDAALTRLGQIIALSERREAWLKQRGDLLRRAGRPKEARAAYAAALAEIHALPVWLRESPDTQKLADEIARFSPPAS